MALKAYGFLLLLVCGITFMQRVCGDGFIEIRFKSYESGCGDCDPMFTFCVDRPDPRPSVDRRQCSYGLVGESDHYHNTGRINFGSNIKGIANPWKVRFGRLHEKSIMLVMRSRDDDFIGADHMVTWGKTLTETVYPTAREAKFQPRSMKKGPHVLEFEIKIYCIDNYYGWDCSRKCIPMDNKEGHYECDRKTGNKICHEGWTGRNCAEDLDECTLGYCQRGTCKNLNGDYYCHCPENYSGRNCSILGDPCESLPCQNNATCTAIENQFNYTCNCSHPWTGQDCDERISPCESGPCLNAGECISNEEKTNFTCDCKPLFEGMFCEMKVEPTTLAEIPGVPGGPSRVTGKDSSEGFLFWHGLLIGICLLIIIIAIILFLVFRRRRKEKEPCTSGLPPGDSVHFHEGNLAFENNMYNTSRASGNSHNHKNGAIRQHPPLPTTPTDDDMFNPVKPVNFCDIDQTQGATGGSDQDESGYMKPSAIEKELKNQDVEPRDNQRAQENPYSDLRNMTRNHNGDGERVEPHYQDLDEIADAFQGLDAETSDDAGLFGKEAFSDHGHSPRTTAKLKAMADQNLEFNNFNYVSSSSSTASDEDDYGESKKQSQASQQQENQYSEPTVSGSSMPGNLILAAPAKRESPYTDVPSNAPIRGMTSTPSLTLSAGDGAYSPIEDESEFDFALAQRITSRRNKMSDSPYAEPAVPASPPSSKSPTDIPDFKEEPYAEMTAPAHRTPSNQLADDYLHDDEDDIPSFGLPHVDVGYASPPGSFTGNPKEPVYADPRDPENVTQPSGNEYASPRSSVKPPAVPPKPQDAGASESRAFDRVDLATPSDSPPPVPALSLSSPPEHSEDNEIFNDTPKVAFPEVPLLINGHSVVNDSGDNDVSQAPVKMPVLFLENHGFAGDEAI